MTDAAPSDTKPATPPLTTKQKVQGCAMLLILFAIIAGIGGCLMFSGRQVSWEHVQSSIPHLAKPPFDELVNDDGNLVRRWAYTTKQDKNTLLAVIFAGKEATRVTQANIIIKEDPADMPTALEGHANVLLLVKTFATSAVNDDEVTAWFAKHRHDEGSVRSFGGAMVVVKQVERSGTVTRTLCTVY